MINTAIGYIKESVKNLKERPNGSYETSHMNVPLELITEGSEYYNSDFVETYKEFLNKFSMLHNKQDEVHMDLDIVTHQTDTSNIPSRISFEITVFKDSDINTAISFLENTED